MSVIKSPHKKQVSRILPLYYYVYTSWYTVYSLFNTLYVYLSIHMDTSQCLYVYLSSRCMHPLYCESTGSRIFIICIPLSVNCRIYSLVSTTCIPPTVEYTTLVMIKESLQEFPLKSSVFYGCFTREN